MLMKFTQIVGLKESKLLEAPTALNPDHVIQAIKLPNPEATQLVLSAQEKGSNQSLVVKGSFDEVVAMLNAR